MKPPLCLRSLQGRRLKRVFGSLDILFRRCIPICGSWGQDSLVKELDVYLVVWFRRSQEISVETVVAIASVSCDRLRQREGFRYTATRCPIEVGFIQQKTLAQDKRYMDDVQNIT